MPPVRRSTKASNSAAATALTFTLTLPAAADGGAPVAGDLIIAEASNALGAVPSGRPAGSTALVNVDDGTVYNTDVVYKTYVSGDTFTFTITGTAAKWTGHITVIQAGTFDPSSPMIAVGAALANQSVALITTPSITPPANALLISSFGNQTTSTWSTTDASPAMTKVADTAATGTSAVSCGVFVSNASPAAGVAITRTATATVSSANGGSWIGYVKPAPAAGTAPPPDLLTAKRRRLILL